MSTVVALSDDEVDALLSTETILSTVERTLAAMGKGRVLTTSKATIELNDSEGHRTLFAMPGVLLDERVAGIKWVGTFANNPGRGLPRAPATILLSDSTTGAPLGVVAATALTARRTAAMAAIAAKHCARPGARRAAILGFGAIGRAFVPLLAALFPIEHFRVWGGDAGRLRQHAARLSQAHGTIVTPAETVEEAVHDADIVLTASGLTSDRPFLKRAMLAPDAFVCGVGSYQEIDEDVIVGAALRVVDDWGACCKRGNFAPVIRAGRIERSSVHAELAGLAAHGLPDSGRETGVGVACLLGIGALDVALAASALRARS
jgi:ornithine cyclodeaminase/alanine dehydrogenase-like protein (mu-crystallin family)